MTILRLLAVFLLSLIYCTKVQLEFMSLGPLYSHVAAGFASASMSMLAFFYAKWTLFLRKKTEGESVFWQFAEIVFAPLVLFYLFTFPFAGFDLPLFEFIAVGGIGVVIIGDCDKKISHFLWKNRFHGYEQYSDSGVVSKKELYNKEALVFVIYFGVPVGLLLFYPMYQL